MKISTFAFLIIPVLVTILVSILCLFTFRGTLKQRFIKATFLTTAIIPISYISNLPWGLIYWDGWEWPVSLLIVGIYGSFVVLITGIINGAIASYLYKRHSESNSIHSITKRLDSK